MEDFYVPAIDGVPGIMPGNVKVPPPPEFEEEEIETAQPQDRRSHHPRNLNSISKHQRRMTPCDKVEKKDK